MKEIYFKIPNTYTCQNCQREIESNEELHIIQGILPLCSQNCKIQLIFEILKRYDEETFKKVWCAVLNNEKMPSNSTSAILKLAVCYSKKVLKDIKPTLNHSKHSTCAKKHSTCAIAQHIVFIYNVPCAVCCAVIGLATTGGFLL